MIKTLYLGNLIWNVTKEDIEKLFSPLGTVSSIKIVKDGITGRPKGYGFITMENAETAMNVLNGKDLCGRSVKINEVHKNYQNQTEKASPKFYIPATNTYC